MDRTKLLIAVVIALLILNTATLVFLWLQRPPALANGPRQTSDPGAVLSQQLGLSQQQQQQFQTLRTAHHAKMVVYGDSLKRLKDSLFVLLLKRDSIHAKMLFPAIGGVHQLIEQVTYDHFQQVRSLLTPEQQQKYDPMLRNAIAGNPRPARDDRNQPERTEPGAGRPGQQSVSQSHNGDQGQPGPPPSQPGPQRPGNDQPQRPPEPPQNEQRLNNPPSGHGR